jgi:hypothetical protein
MTHALLPSRRAFRWSLPPVASAPSPTFSAFMSSTTCECKNTSFSSSADSSPVSSPPQGDSFRRTKKGKDAVYSCAECRRLKLRCDRKVPCQTCTRRGCAEICPEGMCIPWHRLTRPDSSPGTMAVAQGNRLVLFGGRARA